MNELFILELRCKTEPSSAHFSSSGNFFLSQTSRFTLCCLLPWVWWVLTFNPLDLIYCVFLCSLCQFAYFGSVTLSWSPPLSSAPCKTFLHQNVTGLFSICRPLLIPYLPLSFCSTPLMLLLIWPTCTPGSELKKQRKSKNKLVTAVPVDETQADLEHSLFFSFTPFLPSLHRHLSLLLYFVLASIFLSIHHPLLYQFSIPQYLFKGRG